MAQWAARTALMKEVRAKRAAFSCKERKAKRHGHSLDRGASGGKKPKGGPSPPTYASAVKGWAAQGVGQDSQQPSTSGPGQKSHASGQGASLLRSPRQDTGRGGNRNTSHPTSRDRRDPSADSDVSSAQ